MFIAQHLYFLAALYFLFLWIVFFILCKPSRRAMLTFGIAGLVAGPLVQGMHLIDWWRPTFIFESFVHLEDILFGFGVTGVAIAIYDILRNQFLVSSQSTTKMKKIILIVLTQCAVFGLFYWFDVHSFWSSLVAFSIPIVFLGLKKPVLLIPTCLTGILLTLLVTPGYLLGIYLNPNWIQSEWLLRYLSGILVLGIPVEEFVWFFGAGFGLAAFKELLWRK